MKPLLCLALWALIDMSAGVSTKMDFSEVPTFPEEPTFVTVANKTDDEDVEVKHTIVVSTKLKNNNRRGITSSGHGDGSLTYNIGSNNQGKEDSDEVPVIKSYKSVESTQIKTPDTRYKTKIYPDAIFVSRNLRDQGDIYPNVATNPLGWKPANFYNNINYYNHENRDPYTMSRRRSQDPGRIHKKKTEDAVVREFYCTKCAELSRGMSNGCGAQVVQQRSVNSWVPIVHETTTSKVKIDGKLAKLN